MEGQATHLARWELTGDWRNGSAWLRALLAADAERVTQVARRWLAPERAGLVVYRPASAPAIAADPVEIRAFLDGERPEDVTAVARPVPSPPVPGGSRAWRLERQEGPVLVYRLASGVPMLVQRRPGAIGHLGWFVHGGTLHESARDAGITALMARTALKGSASRTAQRVAEDAEFAGGVLGAATTSDGFEWTVSVPVPRLPDAAELLADVVQRPAFRDDALEAERAVALADLAAMRDDMYRWPLRLAAQAAWGEHPYARSTLGTEESLAVLDAGALRRWHAAHALEARGVLVCVADVDPDDAAALGARWFGALREAGEVRADAPPWPRSAVERAERRDKAQTALAMLFPAAARDDDARFAVALIAGVASGLGGRFFDALRDRRSLAYTVTASSIARRHGGAFAAYIATAPDKEEAARAGLLEQFERFRDAPVTDAELDEAKTHALGTWAIRRQRTVSVLEDLADAWRFGRSLREIEDFPDRVRAVSAVEMMTLARRYFDPARRVEGVVRGAGKEI
jgi:zinc protease